MGKKQKTTIKASHLNTIKVWVHGAHIMFRSDDWEQAWMMDAAHVSAFRVAGKPLVKRVNIAHFIIHGDDLPVPTAGEQLESVKDIDKLVSLDGDNNKVLPCHFSLAYLDRMVQLFKAFNADVVTVKTTRPGIFHADASIKMSDEWVDGTVDVMVAPLVSDLDDEDDDEDDDDNEDG